MDIVPCVGLWLLLVCLFRVRMFSFRDELLRDELNLEISLNFNFVK